MMNRSFGGDVPANELFAKFYSSLESMAQQGYHPDRTTFEEASSNIYALCSNFYNFESVHYGHSTPSGHRTKTEPAALATFIPITVAPTSFMNTVLARQALYSEVSILVLDAEIHDTSEFGFTRRYGEGHIARCIELNSQYRPLISAGRCVFLPRSWRTSGTLIDDSWNSQLDAPLQQNPNHLTGLPTNTLPNRRHSVRDMVLYGSVSVPWFEGIDLETVVKIAEEHPDSFQRFHRWLLGKISLLSQQASAKDVQIILQEIEREVSKLHVLAKKLKQSRALRGADVGIFTISLSMIAFLSSPVTQTISGLLGSLTIVDLLKETASLRKERIDVTQSSFYVPYLVRGSGD